MLKKCLLLFCLLSLVGGGLLYYFGSGLIGKAVHLGVETIGSEMTGTPVTLGVVELSLLNGRGTLKDLRIGNPNGYKQESIFSLAQIDLEIDPFSIFSRELRIRKLHLFSPEITYEQTIFGSNVSRLLENVEALGHSGTETSVPAEMPALQSGAQPVAEPAGRKFLIESILVEDITVHADFFGTGTAVNIPKIELQEASGTSIEEILTGLLQAVLKEVSQQVGYDHSQAIKINGSTLKATAGQLLKTTGQQLEQTIAPERLEEVMHLFGN